MHAAGEVQQLLALFTHVTLESIAECNMSEPQGMTDCIRQ